MSVRQYIGARYVTKIYENSLDPSSAEWESGVTYEPLTLVTYLNSSYLSKKDVPGSVGDPAANPDYWVVTGAYNGQIATLQAQIDAINATLADLGSKKYVVICDSYGNRTNVSGRNFYQQAFYDLEITDYYGFDRDGAGFAMTGSLNFLAVLQDNESSIPDRTEITDIIVCGGANDQITPADIDTGIDAFMTYVKTEYPNAKVQIGHFTASIAPAYVGNFGVSIANYKAAAAKYDAKYIENSEFIMLKLAFYDTDNVHPSADGIDALTKYFGLYITGGYFNVHETATATLSDGTNGTLANDYLIQIQNNGIITLDPNYGGSICKFNFATSQSLAAGLNTIDKILTFNDGFLVSMAINNLTLDCKIFSGTTFYDAIIFIDTIQANKLVELGMFIFAASSGTLSSNITVQAGNCTLQPVM